jgi:hypothetical protein
MAVFGSFFAFLAYFVVKMAVFGCFSVFSGYSVVKKWLAEYPISNVQHPISKWAAEQPKAFLTGLTGLTGLGSSILPMFQHSIIPVLKRTAEEGWPRKARKGTKRGIWMNFRVFLCFLWQQDFFRIYRIGSIRGIRVICCRKGCFWLFFCVFWVFRG